MRPLFFAVLVLCNILAFAARSPAGASAPAPQDPATQAKDPNGGPAAPPAPKPAVVVATLGEYTITRDELEQRLVQELHPREEESGARREPVTAEATLREMVAEKAMMIEGRKLGYLQEEMIRSSLEQYEQRQLASMLVGNFVREHVSVAESDVARVLKEDPKLTPEQARMQLQRAAAIPLLDKFYAQLLEKFKLQKRKDNFAQAAQIHDRLLNRPAEPRGRTESWIKNSQVRDELSEAEKGLVLATYEGGQFTLKDWFEVLCNIVPPRRPRDLSTPEGVEALLDRALQGPILVAEAKARGYDKDPKVRADVRRLEDQRLLYRMQDEKTKSATEPNDAQIRAYFDQNQERFGESASLKVDPIWCADRPTADKVKAALEQGADFTALKKEHSLQKDIEAHNIYPGSEGLFWDQLWKAEPNQVVGPVRGFYNDGVRWRIVKVLEKKPAKAQPYSEQVADRVKWAMLAERRQGLLKDCQKELLAKYEHTLYLDRIKDLDPVEVATNRAGK